MEGHLKKLPVKGQWNFSSRRSSEISEIPLHNKFDNFVYSHQIYFNWNSLYRWRNICFLQCTLLSIHMFLRKSRDFHSTVVNIHARIPVSAVFITSCYLCVKVFVVPSINPSLFHSETFFLHLNKNAFFNIRSRN